MSSEQACPIPTAAHVFEQLATIAAERGHHPDAHIDAILRLIADELNLGLAFVARVDGDDLHIVRAYDRADMGLTTGAILPLCDTYCQVTLATDAGALMVEDARADPRFADLATTRDLGIGAYSGVTLYAHDGDAFGTLCTLHPQARVLRESELALLQLAGRLIMQIVAAAELHSREARFRAITEHGTDLICILAPDGTALYGSPSYVRVLGASINDLQRMAGSPIEAIHPDDRERVHEALVSCLASGATATLTCRHRHADGSWRTLECVATNRLDIPAVGGLIVTSRDVTDRVVAEARVRASEQRLQTVVANAPVVLTAVDVDGIVTFTAGSALARLDRTDHDVVGRSLFDVLADAPAAHPYVRQALMGTPCTAIIPYHGRVFEARYAPLLDAEGRVSGAVGVSTDITERVRAEERQARLASIVEASDDAIFGKTLDGVITAWNHGAERLYGYTAEEMVGQPVTRLIPNERMSEFDDVMRAITNGNAIRQFETERVRRDGTYVAIALTVAPIRDRSGAITGASVVARDVSARKEAEEKLRASEERYRQIEAHAPIGLALVSPEGRWLRVNPALCTLVGYTEEELLARTFQDITHHDDIDADVDHVREVLAGARTSYHMEKRYICKDGTPIWISLSASLVRDASGDPLYFIAQIQDIGARKKDEERLRHVAHHDALTGLPNRILFTDRLDQALHLTERESAPLATLLLDLDRFKWVNDTLGHASGDALLRTVAHRLRGALRTSDTVARLGGDEFALLLPLTDERGAITAAQKVLSALAQPISLDGQMIDVSGSIGIALAPRHGLDQAQLLRCADAAMYSAKRMRAGYMVHGAVSSGDVSLSSGLKSGGPSLASGMGQAMERGAGSRAMKR